MLQWESLVKLTDAQLGVLDIAEVNLSCAAGLPGIKIFEPGYCQKKLDHFAGCVRDYTASRMNLFREKPSDYRNTESYFRVMAMITVLQRDLGVRYNPAKIAPDAPFNTEDVFLHGILQGSGGTCASLPVLYAAVGRRLGYPLKLVTARGEKFEHLFARWDGNGERFNIEATAKGFSCFPDDYYRQGVYARTAETEQLCGHLKSLTPREELAGFLVERGLRWRKHEDYRQAVEAFAQALGLAPYNKAHEATFGLTMNAWNEKLEKWKPRAFPGIFFHWPSTRFLPDGVPLKMEREKLLLEATENLLLKPDFERDCWGPARRGLIPRRYPARVDVFYPDNRVEFHVQCVVDNGK